MLSNLMYLRSFLITRLRMGDRGATAVEYGLIVALIAAVIVGIVGILGGQVQAAFQAVSDAIGGGGGGGTP
jgi:pilus assembly protein Flp/PilA